VHHLGHDIVGDVVGFGRKLPHCVRRRGDVAQPQGAQVRRGRPTFGAGVECRRDGARGVGAAEGHDQAMGLLGREAQLAGA
jgi:hypothetical protein